MTRTTHRMTTDQLAAAGELLTGAQWQTGLGRLLGPHHPRGARECVDTAYVRKWVRGEIPIPEWVQRVLARELAQHPKRLARQARQCETLARKLALD